MDDIGNKYIHNYLASEVLVQEALAELYDFCECNSRDFKSLQLDGFLSKIRRAKIKALIDREILTKYLEHHDN